MKCRQIVLASRPSGFPSVKNLRTEEKLLDNLMDGEVLLKAWYISVDPYMRGRMNDVKSYAQAYEVDQPVMGGIVAKIVETKSNKFKPGDIVAGNFPWATFCIQNADNVKKLDPLIDPPSYGLGILGMPGLTAYFGITDIGRPKKGETVVISGAAGAVGIVAGQIARLKGCRVIGITGSDEKCKLLKDELKFNEVLNYKTEKTLKKTIAKICPEGVDIYFDNVGGEITGSVIANLNFHSRVILCGQISQYNNTRIQMVPDILPRLLTRSIMVQGFIVRNYSERFDEGFKNLYRWLNEGSIKYKETIIRGFDNLPEAFLGLFNGKNVGKMLVEAE